MAKFADLFSSGAFRHIVLAFVTALGVSACSTPNQVETYPDVTFEQLSRLNVDAANLDLNVLYEPPLRSPNVEHLAPLSFQTALNTWASRRFVKDPNSGNTIIIRVKEGSITEKALPISTGITGAIKKEQQFEYESVLEVEFRLVGPGGSPIGDVTSRVWQRTTVTEGISDFEKRLVWLELVEKSVNELDAQLEQRFRQQFTNYIQF